MSGELQVVEVGFPRTGTRSLAKAMEILGFSVRHGIKGMSEDEVAKVNQKLLFGDIPSHYNDFQFIGDLPRLHWGKLSPDLKYILTMRDSESWLKSCESRWSNVRRARCLRYAQNGISNPYEMFRLLNGMLTFDQVSFDREAWLDYYFEHNRAIHTSVKPDNLLVMWICSGQSGWETLCSFLGVDIPDVPFPHISYNK